VPDRSLVDHISGHAAAVESAERARPVARGELKEHGSAKAASTLVPGVRRWGRQSRERRL